MRILTIITLLFIGNVWAQNLVPNPSFENHSLPQNQIIFFSDILDWYSPTTGTPDYFTSENTGSILYGMPANIFGYENAYEGNSYIGLSAFIDQGATTINAREYIQTQLINPLVDCNIYYLSFYVSLADSVNYSINKIGGLLTNNIVSRNDFYCISNFAPNVLSDTQNNLTLKVGWQKIDGYFVSAGDENYLTIGNFSVDNSINIDENNNSQNINFSHSYYYIDSVQLVHVFDQNLEAYAGADTSILAGDSVFIGQEISNLNCTWSVLGGDVIAANTSGIYVQPTETTTYVVEQNLCGVITYDSITVTLHGLGISSLEGEKSWMTVVPNPNNGQFALDLSKLNTEKATIQILDASGRIVFEQKDFLETKINTNLSKGVYFLKFENHQGIFEEKLVIQ